MHKQLKHPMCSLIPRLLPVFQCCTQKMGEHGSQNHMTKAMPVQSIELFISERGHSHVWSLACLTQTRAYNPSETNLPISLAHVCLYTHTIGFAAGSFGTGTCMLFSCKAAVNRSLCWKAICHRVYEHLVYKVFHICQLNLTSYLSLR